MHRIHRLEGSIDRRVRFFFVFCRRLLGLAPPSHEAQATVIQSYLELDECTWCNTVCFARWLARLRSLRVEQQQFLFFRSGLAKIASLSETHSSVRVPVCGKKGLLYSSRSPKVSRSCRKYLSSADSISGRQSAAASACCRLVQVFG